MLLHNFTTDELVNRAHNENNTLAITIAERLEECVSEREVELEELRTTLIETYAAKVTEALEEHNKDYCLNAESDYVQDYGYILESEFNQERFSTALTELQRNYYVSEDADGIAEGLSTEDIEQMAADCFSQDGFNLEVVSLYSRSAVLEISGLPLGEHGEELEHWVTDVPEALREAVMAEVCGCEGSTVYYHNNTDMAVRASINVEWLEEWLLSHAENNR